MRRTLLPLLLACVTAAPATATTLVVPDAFGSIGSALAVAVAGDTVLVRAGTYPESVAMVDGVVLRGEIPGTPPVVDASLAGPVLSASACGASTRVEDVVLQHGSGGAFGGGASLANADVVFLRCRFADNVAMNGAGLGASNSDFQTIDCTFETNVATQAGGGLAVTGTSSPTIDGCTFDANSAFAGGAIAVLNGATPLVTGCLAAGNVANEGGAAWWDFFTGGTLTSSTIVETATAIAPSGALHVSALAGPTITACIVALSTAGGATWAIPGSSPAWGCNDAFGNAGGDAFVGGTDLGTNLALDPRFCDAPAGDWTLSDASPCLPDANCPRRGAFDVGCTAVAVDADLAAMPWGRVKALFR